MPTPRFCRKRDRYNHIDPPRDWYLRIGTYQTFTHSEVQRYRCRSCEKTTSDQSESIHNYAKHRLPIRRCRCAGRGSSRGTITCVGNTG